MSQRYLVAGVDGSAGGRRALQWAAAEAQRRGIALHAVIAWRWDTAPGSDTIGGNEADEAARVLSVELASVASNSGAAIERYVLEGRPSDVLIKAAGAADLLVLGSHGHSHRLQQVLGSVTEDCIRGAACPVVVIPARNGG
ncbi:universal stress protein [Catelliglobosispora koreensis]|uniref:universal stress protein n=1 Tax=Catelliglobosispora koreensis TaxID=129052 RepID=UPI0003718385|nr:universal stress protein [Catelliglobosispora koreensis]